MNESTAVKNKVCYIANPDNFAKIPGSPIAYWVSEKFIISFEKGKLLGTLADSKQGIATANNNYYLRKWYEVAIGNIKFDTVTHKEAQNASERWYPYNKGGEFRKWYGNNDFIVNWYHDGIELRNDVKSVIRNSDYYFKRCFSWSLVSSSVAAFRYKSIGHIFDVAGMSCFSNDNLEYLLGLCNSNVTMNILQIIAPTINYQCGDIANIPVLYEENRKSCIDSMVQNNINLSKKDWDSYETSWDFKKHPLI